jgi:phage baseplate assembly protein W
MQILGAPYPIVKNPLGLLKTTTGTTAIKGDLLQLLLTNPGERVMLPTFGVPLRRLLFEQNNDLLAKSARQLIIEAIKDWEPRVTILELVVENSGTNADLADSDDKTQSEHILYIKIRFAVPDNVQAVDTLTLQLPINGGE